ncbi:hypothetical protein DBR47_05945 [Paucibacter sp. KBW04]|uniref:tetratricopeptide repeat protein n=1 Tax=Paucibacter sp. KBW04 TaxID=2153361 RepID=UPI000F57F591|nr:tetratricopeptide repeat protein [Paucibacter sp. KBW04]RQO62043.1 hypothetical protein DBR47_05945 [Paucibacter sp. KBW04]
MKPSRAFLAPFLLALASVCAGLLTGCASAPPPPKAPVQQAFLHDSLFKAPKQAVDVSRVFALSPQMLKYVDQDIVGQLRSKGARQGLLDALYNKQELRLEYESSMTRNASEAFDARQGNCLSLVIMTAAFAKHLDLPLRYQSVYVDEFWTRSEGVFVLSGHVNLSLGRRMMDQRNVVGDPDLLTVDFVPAEERRFQRNRVIEESSILAMYLNNRAAETMLAGELDEAYAWVREALVQEPKLLAAYNTLAVLYRRAGHAAEAEAPLRYVLAQEPANAQAMSNLALILRDLGRSAESETLLARLKELQPYPPYRYFDLGVLAMHAADFKSAKEYFDKEIARSAYVPEFHFWAALASYGLGDLSAARKQMGMAVDNSNTNKDRATYSAKLDWLNAQQRTRMR